MVRAVLVRHGRHGADTCASLPPPAQTATDTANVDMEQFEMVTSHFGTIARACEGFFQTVRENYDQLL